MRTFPCRWLLVLLGVVLLAPLLSEAAGVNLAWDYTQGSTPAVKFRMYRQMQCTGTFVALTPDVAPVGAAPATYSFTETTLQAGQTACYKVTAFAGSGQESAPSNGVSFSMPGILSEPTGLRGTLAP